MICPQDPTWYILLGKASVTAGGLPAERSCRSGSAAVVAVKDPGGTSGTASPIRPLGWGGETPLNCDPASRGTAEANEGERTMQKGLIATVLLTTALLLGPAAPGFARGGGGSGHRGSHAGHASGAWHGGRSFHRHGGFAAGRSSGAWHGGGFHGHGGGGVGVVIGPDVWWGDPWWWGPPGPYYGYPYYGDPYYGSPYYAAPPVYIQQQPAPPPAYWYYCPDSRTYYPYVKECASGWLTVVPPATAPPSGPTP
jgi:hypothetical protein